MTETEKCKCGCGNAGCSTNCLDQRVLPQSPDVKAVQDKITANVITLARACVDSPPSMKRDMLFAEALYATIAHVHFDIDRLNKLYSRLVTATAANGGAPRYSMAELEQGPPGEVILRKTLLRGLRSMATAAWHAALLGKSDAWAASVLMKGLVEIGKPSHEDEEWDAIFSTFAAASLRCRELSQLAHDEKFGEPEPTQVSTGHLKGPFIIVTGHNYGDLRQLLEQAEGKGISVYTHGQLLPAHASPVLKAFTALKGHYGSEWQNQQTEFAQAPGAILLTTDCFLPPTPQYANRSFKTGTMGFPGVTHIIADPEGKKDFTPVIAKAIELGGWPADEKGSTLATGFGRKTVETIGEKLRAGVASGAISKFYFLGGCECLTGDGESIYADFARSLPPDTVLFTLACGNDRLQNPDLGEVAGVPRVIDIGSCSDSFAPVQLVLTLARELRVAVGDLPLTMELAWYEKRSVATLLMLLEIGVKDFELNPEMKASLPDPLRAIIARRYGIEL